MSAYPLARRNQPQWLEISAFLVRQAACGSGPTSVARPAPEAAQPSTIPDGNHGDNKPSLRSECEA